MTSTLPIVLATTLIGAGLAQAASRKHFRGSLPITSSDTRYDKAQFGHILDFDKSSFKIYNQRTMLLSGEFHYWRLPDKSRWESILRHYRSAGLNCIRIYFHWGYHSPADGVYLFDGNRDIDYLLSLCKTIGLYVLAAPGPYICAETQAGGFPIWLAAKREIRLRHMATNLFKRYDALFMEYCVQYFEAILPIIAKHQIFNGGRVIALQIENESFETVNVFPFGLQDDMKALAKAARNLGITVPLFTNDGFEQGSFMIKDDPKSKDFGIDLYGFDKYVVFVPNSAPSSWIMGKDQGTMPDWEPATVEAQLDQMERKVRAFKHSAIKTPIFIPELQGGWFNHYGLNYTYDAIYDFYNDRYTRLMLDSVLSQGCNSANFYMFYGGTNHGTLGDPDVYTSYDYGACIREYGLMSGRLRNLRLGLLFAHSFSNLLSISEAVEPSHFSVCSTVAKMIAQQRMAVDPKTNATLAEFTFFRNFSDNKVEQFDVHVKLKTDKEYQGKIIISTQTLIIPCEIPFKSSFVALGNYKTLNSKIHLVFANVPIVLRGFPSDGGKKEVWIVGPLSKTIAATFAFRGIIRVTESSPRLRPEYVTNMEYATVLRLPSKNVNNGYMILRPGLSDSQDMVSVEMEGPELHIIFLDQISLSTLYCYYSNDHQSTVLTTTKGTIEEGLTCTASLPQLVTWGSYNSYFDPKTRDLMVEHTLKQQTLYILSFAEYGSPFMASRTEFGPGLHFQQKQLLEMEPKNNHHYHSSSSEGSSTSDCVSKKSTDATVAKVLLQKQAEAAEVWMMDNQTGLHHTPWQVRYTNFDAMEWIDCPRKSRLSNQFMKTSLDHYFTSGHILYRGQFRTRTTNTEVKIKINIRHRVTILVNHVFIGSHMVYSRQLFMPGAKMGPDPKFLGKRLYQVGSEILANGTPTSTTPSTNEMVHQVILIIDSLGLSRMPFVLNDVRNPRGLLSACIQGCDVIPQSEFWQVTGVDVTRLTNAYNSTGIPDEPINHLVSANDDHDDHDEEEGKKQRHNEHGSTWHETTSNELYLDPNRGISWFKTTFLSPPYPNRLSVPLRLSIQGEFSAMVILNGTIVGRYFGKDSPQHDFYLMDGLLRHNHDDRGGGGDGGGGDVDTSLLLNDLQLMMYGSATDNDNHNINSKNNLPAGQQISIKILPWVIKDSQGELGQWSGNLLLAEGGGVESNRQGELETRTRDPDSNHVASIGGGPFWTLKRTYYNVMSGKEERAKV